MSNANRTSVHAARSNVDRSILITLLPDFVVVLAVVLLDVDANDNDDDEVAVPILDGVNGGGTGGGASLLVLPVLLFLAADFVNVFFQPAASGGSDGLLLLPPLVFKPERAAVSSAVAVLASPLMIFCNSAC